MIMRIYATESGAAWSTRTLIWRSDRVDMTYDGTYYPVIYDCSCSSEMGKIGSLKFVVGPDHPYYDNFRKAKTILTVLVDATTAGSDGGNCLFRGAVSEISVDIYQQATITANDALEYLEHSLHVPTGKSDQKKTRREWFRKAIQDHNSQMSSDPEKIFVIDESSNIVDYFEGNITEEKSISDTSYSDNMSFIKSNVLDECAGYLQVRYNANFTKQYLNLVELRSYGHTAQQKLKFAVNIEEISHDDLSDDIYTVLVPVGKDAKTIEGVGGSSTRTAKCQEMDGTWRDVTVTIDGKYMKIQEAIDLYGYIYEPVSFSDKSSKEDIVTEALNHIKTTYHPDNFSLKVKALDMHYLDDDTPFIHLGDKVTVIRHSKTVNNQLIERKVTAICTAINYDLTSPENTEFTVGTSFDTLTGSSSGGGSSSSSSSGYGGSIHDCIGYMLGDMAVIDHEVTQINGGLLEVNTSITNINSKLITLAGRVTITYEYMNSTYADVTSIINWTYAANEAIHAHGEMYEQWIEFTGSQVYQTQDQWSSFVGMWYATYDANGNFLGYVYKNGGGLFIQQNDTRFGIFHEGNVGGGITVHLNEATGLYEVRIKGDWVDIDANERFTAVAGDVETDHAWLGLYKNRAELLVNTLVDYDEYGNPIFDSSGIQINPDQVTVGLYTHDGAGGLELTAGLMVQMINDESTALLTADHVKLKGNKTLGAFVGDNGLLINENNLSFGVFTTGEDGSQVLDAGLMVDMINDESTALLTADHVKLKGNKTLGAFVGDNGLLINENNLSFGVYTTGEDGNQELTAGLMVDMINDETTTLIKGNRVDIRANTELNVLIDQFIDGEGHFTTAGLKLNQDNLSFGVYKTGTNGSVVLDAGVLVEKLSDGTTKTMIKSDYIDFEGVVTANYINSLFAETTHSQIDFLHVETGQMDGLWVKDTLYLGYIGASPNVLDPETNILNSVISFNDETHPIEYDGINVTIPYKRLNGTWGSLTFKNVTSVTGSWSDTGGIYTVMAGDVVVNYTAITLRYGYTDGSGVWHGNDWTSNAILGHFTYAEVRNNNKTLLSIPILGDTLYENGKKSAEVGGSWSLNTFTASNKSNSSKNFTTTITTELVGTSLDYFSVTAKSSDATTNPSGTKTIRYTSYGYLKLTNNSVSSVVEVYASRSGSSGSYVYSDKVASISVGSIYTNGKNDGQIDGWKAAAGVVSYTSIAGTGDSITFSFPITTSTYPSGHSNTATYTLTTSGSGSSAKAVIKFGQVVVAEKSVSSVYVDGWKAAAGVVSYTSIAGTGDSISFSYPITNSTYPSGHSNTATYTLTTSGSGSSAKAVIKFGQVVVAEKSVSSVYVDGWKAAAGVVSVPTSSGSNSYIDVSYPITNSTYPSGHSTTTTYTLTTSGSALSTEAVIKSGDTIVAKKSVGSVYVDGWKAAVGVVSVPTSSGSNSYIDVSYPVTNSTYPSGHSTTTTYTLTTSGSGSSTKAVIVSGTTVVAEKSVGSIYTSGWSNALNSVGIWWGYYDGSTKKASQFYADANWGAGSAIYKTYKDSSGNNQEAFVTQINGSGAYNMGLNAGIGRVTFGTPATSTVAANYVCAALNTVYSIPVNYKKSDGKNYSAGTYYIKTPKSNTGMTVSTETKKVTLSSSSTVTEYEITAKASIAYNTTNHTYTATGRGVVGGTNIASKTATSGTEAFDDGVDSVTIKEWNYDLTTGTSAGAKQTITVKASNNKSRKQYYKFTGGSSFTNGKTTVYFRETNSDHSTNSGTIIAAKTVDASSLITVGSIAFDCTDQGDPTSNANDKPITASAMSGSTVLKSGTQVIHMTTGSWKNGKMAVNARMTDANGKLITRIWLSGSSVPVSITKIVKNSSGTRGTVYGKVGNGSEAVLTSNVLIS